MNPHDPQCMDQEVDDHNTNPAAGQVRNEAEWNRDQLENICIKEDQYACND